MNRKRLIYGCILVAVTFAGYANACCEPPVASFSANPTNVIICQQVSFDASASYDPDGTTLTYSWDFGDGETGTGKTTTHRYRCTGTKTVGLIVWDNDDPECCGGQPNCSDKSDTDSKDVTVSLPTGCSECSGAPEISLDANMLETENPSMCDTCACGAAGPPENILVTVATPCYDNCSWKLSVMATADFPFGPCTDSYFDIGSAESGLVEEGNYCDIVDGFDYDPYTQGTGVGCPWSDGFYYSNSTCVWFHEAQHAADFLHNLEDEEAALATDPALGDIAIDCSDSTTRTCQAAKNAREQAIKDAVNEAYMNAWGDCTEESALESAWECFHNLAVEICNRSYREGWTPCGHCH
jgi:hypothetical protein